MKNGNQTNSFDILRINGAMRFLYDTMEKLMLDSSYVLLNETAQLVCEGNYENLTQIEAGIGSRYFTPEVRSFLNEWGFDEKDGVWKSDYESIPVVIKEITRNYEFFKHPETRYYDVDTYNVPNPFEKYWKARFIIK